MSLGQVIGGIAGGVIGLFVGSPILGAQIGMMVGGAIDPPKGPSIKGPRLSDLRTQTVEYGSPLPRIYGSCAVYGTVIWLENNQLKEVAKTEEVGGKGGPSQEQTTYSYYATFAVAFASSEIAGVRRIWAGQKLIYDAGATEVGVPGDSIYADAIRRILGSDEAAISFKIYTGSDTQLPDPRMQAALGIANTPAFRGIAYAVFEDYPLADHGNSLLGCPMKFEVVNSTPVFGSVRLEKLPGSPLNDGSITSVVFGDTQADMLVMKLGIWNSGASGHRIYSNIYGIVFNGPGEYSISGCDSYARVCNNITQTDGNFYTIWKRSVDGGTTTRLHVVGSGGGSSISFGPFTYAQMSYYAKYSCAVASEVYNGVSLMTIYYVPWDSYTKKIMKISSAEVIITTVDYTCRAVGYSENYLFVLNHAETGDTVVHKLRRSDLVEVASYTQAGTGFYLDMEVVSDDLFYTMSRGVIYRWDSGVPSNNGTSFGPPNSSGKPLSYSDPSRTTFFHVIDWDSSRAVAIRSADVSYYSWMTYASLPQEGAVLGDIVEAECLLSGVLQSSDLDKAELTSIVKGFRVASVGSIRNSLSMLQAAWPFDVVQEGYQLAFRTRARSVEATVYEDELGAASTGSGSVVRLTKTREMESQIPNKVQVKFIDQGREYDNSAGPCAQRLRATHENVFEIELPIVMTSTEAAKIEEVLLYMYWLERVELSFSLPPTRADFLPARVINIVTSDATYEARLTSINYLPDGSIECTARLNNSAIYSSSAVADGGNAPGQTLSISGPTLLALMDVPALDGSAMLSAGFLVGLGGYVAGWRGGTLFRSADQGQTWAGVTGASSPGMNYATALGALGYWPTHIIDTNNTLNVKPLAGSFSSVSELQMLNGANHFAIGANGRWEIIAAQTATAELDGTYTLSNLMRGRFGTEWAVGLHAIGDDVVQLDSPLPQFLGMNVGDINLQRLYRAVSSGASLDAANEYEFAYSGVNLKPLSPIEPRAWREAFEGYWTISWTRRSRAAMEMTSGVNTPLNEAVEAYEVDIYNAAFTVVLRTLTSASASVVYSAANQMADFGALQSSLNVKIYQLSETVGRGYPLAVNLAVDRQQTPYLTSFHFDGTNGQTAIVSEQGAAVITNYGPCTLTTSSPKFGTACLSIPNLSDYYLLVAVNGASVGTGDYCIRWFEYSTIANFGRFHWANTIIQGGNGSSYGIGYSRQGGHHHFYWNGSTRDLGAATETLNAWKHCAVERYNGVVTVYYDGVPHGTTLADSLDYTGNNYLHIGCKGLGSVNFRGGKIDDFEFLPLAMYKGAAFTPPTAPF